MIHKWLTTQQVVALTGYTGDHVRRLIKTGRVKARKVSIIWLVDRDSLLAYLRDADKLGERRGPKPRA